MNNVTAKPFVKWAGGKRSLLPEIFKHLPESLGYYFEPFVGGGALFFALFQDEKTEFAKDIKGATLIDNNLELAITYQVVKKEPGALLRALAIHEKRHTKEYFYRVRKRHPKSPIEVAARFIYLNRTCFNGLYRVNQSGEFNAPIGSYTNPSIVQEENIMACHKVLQRATVLHGDFIMAQPEKGDFVYCDPPYHPVNETSFTAYTEGGFGDQDQVRLRDFLRILHKKGVFIMLSNSNTEFIRGLYREKIFHHHEVSAPRNINCKATERNAVTELLITNYPS